MPHDKVLAFEFSHTLVIIKVLIQLPLTTIICCLPSAKQIFMVGMTSVFAALYTHNLNTLRNSLFVDISEFGVCVVMKKMNLVSTPHIAMCYMYIIVLIMSIGIFCFVSFFRRGRIRRSQQRSPLESAAHFFFFFFFCPHQEYQEYHQ